MAESKKVKMVKDEVDGKQLAEEFDKAKCSLIILGFKNQSKTLVHGYGRDIFNAVSNVLAQDEKLRELFRAVLDAIEVHRNIMEKRSKMES